MHQEIIMAGMGGQGVMVIGQLLAHAAMLEDMNVVWFPTYGAETRGGIAECTVIISDTTIGSPISSSPDYLIALTQQMLDKFVNTVKPGGTIIANTSLITKPAKELDCNFIELRASEISEEIGSAMSANMIMLGAYLGVAKPVSVDLVKSAMSEVLPKRHHKFIPLNCQALDRGYDITR